MAKDAQVAGDDDLVPACTHVFHSAELLACWCARSRVCSPQRSQNRVRIMSTTTVPGAASMGASLIILRRYLISATRATSRAGSHAWEPGGSARGAGRGR